MDLETGIKMPLTGWNLSLKWDTLTFAYSNARAKAMKSLLLPQNKIREMIAVKNVDTVIAILEETGYKQELVEFSTKYSGADLVERALTTNLARTLNKLLKISPKCGKKVLHALFKKWETHNIKTILVGKNQAHSNEKIEASLLNVGAISEEKLRQMLQAKTVEEAIEKLRNTEYYTVLAPLVKKYAAEKNVLPFVNALDEYYYAGVAESTKQTGDNAVSEIINSEIDAKNISNVLRAKANKLTAQQAKKLTIKGGRISEKTIQKMLEAPDAKTAAQLVPGYDLSKAVKQFEETSSITSFEVELEKQIVLFAIKKMRLASVSLAALAGYLYLKEAEIANIRKIVRAKEFGLSQEKITQMVYAIE
ncbi:V-type ATPase subunit [Candidatus Micrarchaeota archaeon]|nr:V-type ATPase subunit [Candidatus Micrarchaeota archaeon]